MADEKDSFWEGPRIPLNESDIRIVDLVKDKNGVSMTVEIVSEDLKERLKPIFNPNRGLDISIQPEIEGYNS